MQAAGFDAESQLAEDLDALAPRDSGEVAVGGSCGGLAPDTNACSTGDHTRGVMFAGMSHGFNVPPAGYTGALRSTLSHAGGARVFTCTYFDGTNLGCVGSGTFPAPGAAFSHACESLDFTSGAPGGAGPWACRVRHSLGCPPAVGCLPV
jgi:hypothetical protein